jgi:dsRNA-specific ribonuclease
VLVDDQELARGQGRSKKDAEQKAAQAALALLAAR